MTTKAQLLTLITLAGTLMTGPAQTAQTTATPAPKLSETEQTILDIKNPTDWFMWGADLRVRNEYIDNAVTLNEGAALHEQDVIRFRGRLWASAEVVTNLLLNGRLAAEPREWLKPAFPASYFNKEGLEWRYGIADNLNVQWKNILDQPMAVTAGRQDILLGDYYDWWLVADGTPNDGSWTFFLDSIRLTYEAKPIKTKFDLIYIYQNPTPDEWLPVLGSAQGARGVDYTLTDQREQGVVVYGSNKSLKNTQIDGYFIYKHDDRETFTGLTSPTTVGPVTPGDNADIYTVGGKITGTPAENWQYSVEGAYQFGWKQDKVLQGAALVDASRDIDAYGGKAKLTYLFKDKMNNQVSLIGEYLSGDDPKTTGKDEMFDVLWGRWPRWSELYIFSYINETGGRIAQLNNIGRFGPAWSLTPVKNLTFSAMYNALYAPEETPTRRRAAAATSFSYDGNFRGHYLQTILKYQFSKHLSGHLWGEWVWQGDFYAQRDVLSFLRGEIMLTF